MSERPEYVQLDTSDDANSVRDRLSFLRGRRVLLIWPEQGTVLTRKLDLVLIQREAMRRAIRVALVTHDPRIIQHAQELNISTFETIGGSERGRWKRGRSKVFTNRSQRPKDSPDPDDLMEVASRVRVEDEPPGAKLRRRVLRISLLLGLLLGLLGVAYVVLPSAAVVITPARETRSVEVTITADRTVTAVDVENRLIPATTLQIEIEETGSVGTTGIVTSENIPAVGAVVFINQTSRALDIPVDTTVSTSTGTPVFFRTTAPVRVAAGVGSQVEVPVEALPGSAGAVGNVEAGQINTVVGELNSSVTVRNISPTSGGENRSLPAVTQQDRDRLLAIIRQQIQERAYAEMLARMSGTQFMIVETLRITAERSDWTEFSAEVGEITDTLTLRMRAVVEAQYVDLQFGQQLVFAELTRNTRGRFVQPQTVDYDFGAVQAVDPAGRVTFTMSGAGVVVAQVNTSQLQERLAGRSLTDAQIYLLTEISTDPNVPPVIEVSPAWFSSMPLLPMRIEIHVEGGA